MAIGPKPLSAGSGEIVVLVVALLKLEGTGLAKTAWARMAAPMAEVRYN